MNNPPPVLICVLTVSPAAPQPPSSLSQLEHKERPMLALLTDVCGPTCAHFYIIDNFRGQTNTVLSASDTALLLQMR